VKSRSSAAPKATSHDKIFAVVRRIPRGRVSTYGAIARVAGLPRQARLVGYALHRLGGSTRLPWHRVINASGHISLSDANGAATTQRLRLIAEGVAIGSGGRISLARYGWPTAPATGKSRSFREATREG
jgi:methylated-DNA-protein-cysteine methyltransferase related protein